MKTKTQRAAADAKRARVLSLCDTEPQTASAITTAMGLPERGVDHYLSGLQERGLIKRVGVAKGARWMSMRLYRQISGTQPSVTIPERPEWILPTPSIEVRDGVRVTVAPAPRGRFEADIRPGEGVISRDWAARRGGE